MKVPGGRLWLLSLPLLAVLFFAAFKFWFRHDSPPFDESWPIATSERAGVDRTALKALDRKLAEHGTDAWLIVQNGEIVHEWYRDPEVNKRFGAASMSKALVGGLGLMLAADRGLLQWDQPASDYVEAWRAEPLRDAVTLQQLADHSSGLAHPAEPNQADKDAKVWETGFWERRDDLIDLVEADVPLLFEPGTDYGYSGPAYAVLSHALAEAMRGSDWPDLKSLLNDNLMTALDLHPASWSIGYQDDVFDVDGLDLYATWGGAAFTLRATARIGLLLAEGGHWNGRQILSEEVVRAATSYVRTEPVPTPIEAGEYPAPALGWWSNEFGALKSLPRDAFLAAGAEHRVLAVVPSKDLIIVRYGTRLGEDHWDGDFWHALDERLLAPAIDAIEPDPQTAMCCGDRSARNGRILTQ